jgi:hypothetical protein
LYNVLIKKNVAEKLGLGKVSKPVRMDIAAAIAGMPLEASLGWKARLGRGPGGPAERAIEFERAAKESPLIAFQRITEEMDRMLGPAGAGNTAVREIKARQILSEMMPNLSKEGNIELARAIAKGDLTSKKTKDIIDEQMKLMKEQIRDQKNLSSNIKKTVDYASQVATNTTALQEIVKQKVIHYIMGILSEIRDILDSISKFLKTETPEERAERSARAIETRYNLKPGSLQKRGAGFAYAAGGLDRETIIEMQKRGTYGYGAAGVMAGLAQSGAIGTGAERGFGRVESALAGTLKGGMHARHAELVKTINTGSQAELMALVTTVEKELRFRRIVKDKLKLGNVKSSDKPLSGPVWETR